MADLAKLTELRNALGNPTDPVIFWEELQEYIYDSKNLDTGQTDTLWVAGENLSGDRIVYAYSDTEVKYADKDTLSHESRVVGITLNASNISDKITVRTNGIATEGSWTWTPSGTVFLSTNGFLTQTPPTTGFVLDLGVALSATSIFLSIKTPVELV